MKTDELNINKGELKVVCKNLIKAITTEIIELAPILANPQSPPNQIDFVCAKISTLNGIRERIIAWRTQHESTEEIEQV